ncbi:hypothetical protein M0804_012578 [Polistes exclamans]|nr:hypothetical protein M0804_012578 [Polistes exclamans]
MKCIEREKGNGLPEDPKVVGLDREAIGKERIELLVAHRGCPGLSNINIGQDQNLRQLRTDTTKSIV